MIPRAMKPFLLLASGLLAVSVAAAAEPTARQSEAYQASVAQDGLRRDAASIRAELVRVRDQMREFLPDDVATVDLALRQLDSLSKEEMERVVLALRGASQPEALTGQARALADALHDQGSISTSLKKLAVNLEARQSMEGLAGEVSALLQRQVAARDELARLARKEPTPDRLHGHDHERWEAVNEDQRRVSEDTKLLLPQLERLADALSDGGQERFARAVSLARDGKLDEAAERAAQGSAQGPFPQAVEIQNGVVALLASMEAALADASNPAERLAALRAKLQETLAKQQEVTGLIAGFHERQSVEQQTKRLQTTLSDQIARLRAELGPLDAPAAAELQAAQDAAESASQHYERMWEERPEAQRSTRDASARLEAALQSVDKQIAALPERTPGAAAQLRRPPRRARPLAQAQAALNQPQADLGAEKTAARAVNGFDTARQGIADAQKAAAQAGAPTEAQQALAEAARDIEKARTDAATLKLGQAQADTKTGQAALARAGQAMAAARQAQARQPAASLPSQAGNDPGQRQKGNSGQGQGNGGGGGTGDTLAGAGNASQPLEPVSGLNPQDRAAVVQLQNQKPPAEYTSDVEQYYKNIADAAGLQP